MASLSELPEIAITLLVVAIVFAASFIGLASLKANTTDTNAIAGINNITQGMTNVVVFSPTWGTLIGVGVIIAVVVGSIWFFAKRSNGGV